MSMTSRQLALRELSFLRQKGDDAFSTCLNKIQTKKNVEPRERALAERMFTGTYQNLSYLDFVLAGFCHGNYKTLHPLIKDILRLSAYQIIFLDRIPSRAAVNEAVSLAKKKVNPRSSGLVNAVLRKLADCYPDFPKPEGKGSAEYLSTLYSHPAWLAKSLIDRIGYDRTADFFRLNNQPADITIHVNTITANPEDVFSSLDLAGVAYTRPCGLEACFRVPHLDENTISMLSSGLCYVQDLSALMSVYAAAPKPGDTVIDACAAPGGKSFSAALMMNGDGRIFASDLSSTRLERMQQALKRMRMEKIISCSCLDASDPLSYSDICADVVIVDAPCSGFGTIRKKPDIRAKEYDDTTHLHSTQRAILDNCSKSVKAGGTLVYSTCTVFPEENENIVTDFLSSHNDFVLEDYNLPEPFGTSQGGMMTIWPWVADSDGFFIAKMRRK